MTAAKPIRAAFTGYRPVPSRSVGLLTFEVALEALDAAVAALGGTPLPSRSVWCALVRLDDRTAAEATSRASAAEPHPLVKRAGILAKDPAFQRWCGAETEHGAAAYIRTRCQIASRRDIATNVGAAAAFEAVETEFRASQYSPHLTGRK